MPIDKSWMNVNRRSSAYKEGLNAFIELAKQHAHPGGEIYCPCKKCCNVHMHMPDTVKAHVFDYGMKVGYTTWTYHGEVNRARTAQVVVESGDEMAPVLNDFIGIGAQEQAVDKDDAAMLTELISKLHEEVYPGCKKSSALKFLADLMHIKVLYKWPNESVDILLKKLKEILPEGSNLPDSFYEANKLMDKLGLGYEKIDVCSNDCALYYKENANLDACPVCNTSRYNITKGKKVPCKVLRYFPLKPRLRRLYASRHTAKEMTWHKTGCSTDEDVMRHPVDGKEWKEFDLNYPEFASEPRNVRLSLASDGFDPFGFKNSPYSMWPVLMQVLNPPPWLCNKDPYRYLTLLIPGPKAPGKDIHVYLRPLVDELQELWSEGIIVHDSATDTTFNMRAALLMTINDFPARSYLSGWSGQGYKACPTCNEDTPSVWLTNKMGFLGHRRYLRVNHPMRKNKGFNGKVEKLPPPSLKTTEQLFQQLQNLEPCLPGKHPSYGGKKRKRPESCLNWTTKSIFWSLPYWRQKKLQYNLDPMHIEKTVHDSLVNTLLDIDNKSKDTVNARKDLMNMNVRKELHLYQQGNDVMKPHAAYTLTKENRIKFCDFLKEVRFPDGFAGNLKKNVIAKDKLAGLKSHDCHVILQRLLPIGIRPFIRKDISDAITDLSDFFRMICARTLKVSDLEKSKEKVLEILCNLETIFPPAFFDIMVHLIMHLPEEAIRGGPVHLRWMYPIERFLGTLKKYIRNRARPEGSIARAYAINEIVTFCSLYFSGNETKFNRPERNWVENEDPNVNRISVFKSPFRTIGKMSSFIFDHKERLKAEWYVFQNCTEISPYLDEHRRHLACSCSSRYLDEKHREQFPKWFHEKMSTVHQQSPSDISDQLLALATGSLTSVRSYPGCVINGVKFVTHKRDLTRTTQNSGIAVKGPDDNTFYGILEDVYVISYPRSNSIVLFKCKWFDTSPAKKGVRVYKNRKSIYTKNTWYDNEPFILASQAEQVFYVDDLYNGKDWKVVEHFRHRHIWDLPSGDVVDENVVTEETTHGNFQLFVELPPIESSSFRLDQSDIDPTVVTPNSSTNDEDSSMDDDTDDAAVDATDEVYALYDEDGNVNGNGIGDDFDDDIDEEMFQNTSDNEL